MADEFFLKTPDFHVNIQESFTCRKSTTWDRRLTLPSEGRRSDDFFALKNPTASAGFEPTNLGTKDQHATSRPPKPLSALYKLHDTPQRVFPEFNVVHIVHCDTNITIKTN